MTRVSNRRTWLLMCVVTASLNAHTQAADKNSSQTGSDSIKWIEQLTDDEYKIREHAAKQLRSAGVPAIGPLVKALDHKDAGVVLVARAILLDFAGRNKEPLGSTARKAIAKPLAEELSLVNIKRAERWVRDVGGTVSRSSATTASRGGIVVDLASCPLVDDQSLRLLDYLLQSYEKTERISLILNNTSVGDRGIEHISEVSGLWNIDLSTTNITDSSVRCLVARHPKLHAVDLSNTKITDAVFESLSELSLSVLKLGETAVTERGLALLQEHKNLSRLSLANTNTTAAGLRHLSKLPSLRTLDLNGVKLSDTSMGIFLEFPLLSSLSLNDTTLSDDGLASCGNLLSVV